MPLALIGILLYLAAISLVAFVLTVSDKRRAKKQRWRIPEATLLWVGALGGAAAMLATMRWIRHKTRHRKFMWGLPLMLAAHALLLGWALWRGWITL